MSDDLEIIARLNRDAVKWGRESKHRMQLLAPKGKRSGGDLGLAQSIVLRNNYYGDGQIEAIGFKFKRSGVFAEMGVFGGLTRREAISQGKLNPKPWFNPVLAVQIPKLLDLIGENYADRVELNLSRLEIKNA